MLKYPLQRPSCLDNYLEKGHIWSAKEKEIQTWKKRKTFGEQRKRQREKEIYWRNKLCDGGRTNELREIVQYSIWPESAMNQMEVLMKIERGTNIEKCFESCPPIIYTIGAFWCSPVFNSIWIFKAALLCKALVSLPLICAHTIYKQRTRSGLVKLENLITWTQMVLVLPGALMEFQKPPWEIFCVIISGAVGPATFSSCCQKTKFIPLAILVWIWRDPSLELDATFDGPRCVGRPCIVFGWRQFI